MSRLGRSFKAGRSSIPPFYHPTSLFNRKLGPSDTLAADQTPAYSLANQIQYGRQTGYTFQGYSGVGYGFYNWPGSIAFNYTTFTHPIYCVTNKDAKQAVGFWSKSGSTYSWIGNSSNAGLQTYFTAVPIPDKTQCPVITGIGNALDIWSGPIGSDQSCFIWNRDTDEGWEFWVLNNTGTPATLQSLGYNWSAGFGGYIPSVSNFNGVFANGWGSRACSLGEIGGLITMQDIRDVFYGGTINHAIACSATNCSGGHVAPASRGDGGGNNTPASIPSGFPGAGSANPAHGAGIDVLSEGQRFTFPSSLDPDTYTGYPLAREITRAIRDYGLILMDGAGLFSLYIEDPRTIGSPYHMQGANAVNPITGLNWAPINGGNGDPRRKSNNDLVVNDVPWGQLQVLNPISR